MFRLLGVAGYDVLILKPTQPMVWQKYIKVHVPLKIPLGRPLLTAPHSTSGIPRSIPHGQANQVQGPRGQPQINVPYSNPGTPPPCLPVPQVNISQSTLDRLKFHFMSIYHIPFQGLHGLHKCLSPMSLTPLQLCHGLPGSTTLYARHHMVYFSMNISRSTPGLLYL